MASLTKPRRSPRLRYHGRDLVTVLDLGAHTISCAILRFPRSHFGFNSGARDIDVVGFGVAGSFGFSQGHITDFAAVEGSIRRAVGQAESDAGSIVKDVLVTGQFHGLESEVFEAKMEGTADFVPANHFSDVSRAAHGHCFRRRRKLLHLFLAPSETSGDGLSVEASTHPLGHSDVVAVSVPITTARKVSECVNRSLLSVSGMVAGPFASALAVTNPIERNEGVLVVDIGAHSTGLAVFAGGVPQWISVIPVGGSSITSTLAEAFSLPRHEAERLKVRFGSVFDGLHADVQLPLLNGETADPLDKLSVNRIIRSRAAFILEAVNERLKEARYAVPDMGAVLTGGSSALPGLLHLSSQMLSCETRLPKPAVLKGLEDAQASSAVVGVCLSASASDESSTLACSPKVISSDVSYASRISQWLRTSF